MIEIDITPIPKPRMIKSDSWKKRPVVLNYWAYADKLRSKCKGVKLGDTFRLSFIIPMPKSWTGKKKLEMDGKPHQQTPDIDNLIKSFFDPLFENDSHIYSVHADKYWGRTGKILIH